MSEKKYLVTLQEIADIAGIPTQCEFVESQFKMNFLSLNEEWLEAHEFHEHTCRMEGADHRFARCTACGAFVDTHCVTDCCGYIRMPFCPNCRAKVVE